MMDKQKKLPVNINKSNYLYYIISLILIFGFLLLIFNKWPRSYLLSRHLFLFGAILVALSRIMVGVNFPSDVFGGILLGTFGAYAVKNYFPHKGWLKIKTQ